MATTHIGGAYKQNNGEIFKYKTSSQGVAKLLIFDV